MMPIKVTLDLSVFVSQQHNNVVVVENVDDTGEESSTESTFYEEDCKALEAFFDDDDDDDSSMCSSSSEESLESCEYDGTYTRTFGDEDSLVLAKGRHEQHQQDHHQQDQQQQDEPEAPIAASSHHNPGVSSSSRAVDILHQVESILDGLTITVPSNTEILYTSLSSLRFPLNRRAPPRGNNANATVDHVNKTRRTNDLESYIATTEN